MYTGTFPTPSFSSHATFEPFRSQGINGIISVPDALRLRDACCITGSAINHGPLKDRSWLLPPLRLCPGPHVPISRGAFGSSRMCFAWNQVTTGRKPLWPDRPIVEFLLYPSSRLSCSSEPPFPFPP